jgi:hypothetical protein
MKRNRLIFYSVFGALHLFIFGFSLYMDGNSENIGFLLSLQGKIGLLKYCSLFLLIMFITNIVLHVRDINRNKRISDAQSREITELKAKLYDKGQQPKTPTPAA